MQEFSLSDPNSTSANNSPHLIFRLRIPNMGDGDGLKPEEAQKTVDVINKKINDIKEKMGGPINEPISILSHCSAGMGRSPSILVYHAIDAIARAEADKGRICCCDFSKQKQPAVDGKFNLAWGLRVFLLNGFSIRSVFGLGKEQFDSYVEYAKFRAEKSISNRGKNK